MKYHSNVTLLDHLDERLRDPCELVPVRLHGAGEVEQEVDVHSIVGFLRLEPLRIVSSRHWALSLSLPSLPDVVLDAGSEGEGGALGLDVDCVGPR